MAALDWFEAHRELLMACIDQARERDLGHWVIRLTAVMAGFLRNNGPWDQGIERHAAAASAAARLGDRIAHGVALNDLGIMCRLAGRPDQALAALHHAHDIFTGTFPASVPERDLWLGQANALNEQAIVHNNRGDPCAAMLALEPALALYHKASDRIGVANASKNLGVALYRAGLDRHDTGLCAQALRCLSDATSGYAAIGDELGVAEVSNHQGRLRLHTGDVTGALADFRRALDIVQRTGSLLEAARASEGAGECHLLNGDHDLARRDLEAAAQIYTDIRANAHVRDVAAKLVRLKPAPR
jgi:tetratricopeptide (TPR) repeat protein